MRGARAALIGGDDDAEAAFGRELQRLLLRHSKLGSEDMHGPIATYWDIALEVKNPKNQDIRPVHIAKK